MAGPAQAEGNRQPECARAREQTLAVARVGPAADDQAEHSEPCKGHRHPRLAEVGPRPDRLDVDLHDPRVLRQEGRVGEAGADHEQRLAGVHRLLRRLGPEQPQPTRREGVVVRYGGLREIVEPGVGAPAGAGRAADAHPRPGQAGPEPASAAVGRG